jgi:hypothetical protein
MEYDSYNRIIRVSNPDAGELETARENVKEKPGYRNDDRHRHSERQGQSESTGVG